MPTRRLCLATNFFLVSCNEAPFGLSLFAISRLQPVLVFASSQCAFGAFRSLP